jgi:hypothetical protein
LIDAAKKDKKDYVQIVKDEIKAANLPFQKICRPHQKNRRVAPSILHFSAETNAQYRSSFRCKFVESDHFQESAADAPNESMQELNDTRMTFSSSAIRESIVKDGSEYI